MSKSYPADLIYRHPFTSPMSVGLTLPPRTKSGLALFALARGSSAITATGDDHALAWIYHLWGGSVLSRTKSRLEGPSRQSTCRRRLATESPI